MMKLIKHLACQIDDEIEGATEYAKNALEYKEFYPWLADSYHKLAIVENEHAMTLHNAVCKIINEVQSKGVEYPQEMMDKWEKKHKKMMCKMAKAKTFIGMYK